MLSNSCIKVYFTCISNFSSIDSDTDSVDEHYEEILLSFKGVLWKHCLQTGL